MPRKPLAKVDEDLERAMKHIDEMLKDPIAFDKWVDETLDMSRMRRR